MGGAWPDAQSLGRADAATLDSLDARMAAFTAKHDDFELMGALQARGVAAGVVQDAEDLLERDPQLRGRPAFLAVEHPVLGRFDHQTSPYHLSRTPASLGPAPLLGQHTEMVCREVLQLSAETFAELEHLFF
jgi:benzylsuccinate CoA-transferase BbsF subunit